MAGRIITPKYRVLENVSQAVLRYCVLPRVILENGKDVGLFIEKLLGEKPEKIVCEERGQHSVRAENTLC